MKKIIIAVLCLILTVSVCAKADINIDANAAVNHSETVGYNWYCMREKDHIQPKLDSLLSFAENCNAYYVDKSHESWDDKEKVIYLTFDAGYENGNIEKILDVLKNKNVNGAFFILENMTERFPDLVKRMADEGHLVCNHTARHKDMTTFNDSEFTAELKKLEDDCASIGVECRKYYRPPEGRFSEANLKCAESLGYKTIFWSFAYADWDNNKQPDEEGSIEKILKYTHNGEIILLHPTSSTNAAIIGRLIDAWQKEGFRFGTLDEL